MHAESLCCGLTGQEIQTGTNADEAESLAQETDIENQYYVPQDNDQNNSSSPQQNGEQCNGGSGKLWAALLSLCMTVCDTLITEDQDFAHQFFAIVPGEDAFSFARKLKEMVERNSHPTADCLRTMKLISKMVISMMKQRQPRQRRPG